MSQPIVAAWDATLAGDFLRRPLTFAHTVLGRPQAARLFDDAHLAELLERHPDTLTDVNLYETDHDGLSRVRTGARGALPGVQILDAVRQGRLWVNLRSVQQANPALGEIAQHLLRDLERLNPGLRVMSSNAHLLISAPHSRVPYHADMPGVVLLHLRGRKRIWVYPTDETYLPDTAMEDIALRVTTEDLVYLPEFDTAAAVFDLEPGMALSWPINAPHRVENLGTLNVSLSIEFMTWEARLRHGVYYAHGALRRLGISPPRSDRVSKPGAAARWALAVALKRLNVHRRLAKTHRVDFNLATSLRDDGARRA